MSLWSNSHLFTVSGRTSQQKKTANKLAESENIPQTINFKTETDITYSTQLGDSKTMSKSDDYDTDVISKNKFKLKAKMMFKRFINSKYFTIYYNKVAYSKLFKTSFKSNLEKMLTKCSKITDENRDTNFKSDDIFNTVV